MSEKLLQKIDQKNIDMLTPEIPYSPTASIALELGSLAIKFSNIERTPRYNEQSRESDVEHSFMLALIAGELAQTVYPGELDGGRISQYAIVHDLIELKTGDIATFQLTASELQKKEATEHVALESLLAELPPHTGKLLYDYEQQADKESRFVRAVDKLLPIVVDILGAGYKVMADDYHVHSSKDLLAAHTLLRLRMAERFLEFPQIVNDHSLLCELLQIDMATTLKQQ